MTNLTNVLLTTLKFYANPENWKDSETGIGMHPGECESDRGALARTVVEEVEPLLDGGHDPLCILAKVRDYIAEDESTKARHLRTQIDYAIAVEKGE
jgi:hypothetical protein